MKAIILAAGVGKRLGGSAAGKPKCLLKVGNLTLLHRMLDSLQRFSISPVIVVGYEHQQIRDAVVASHPGLSVEFVQNDDFTEGSIVSLRTAREHLTNECLLMDADVLFPDEFLRRLIDTRHGDSFLLDRSFSNDGEAMVAAAMDGHMVGFERGISVDYDICGESIGFFKISAPIGPHLLNAIEARLNNGERAEHYEAAILDTLKEHPFGYEDVTGLPWTEVDFPEDAERARTEVLPLIESSLPVRKYILLNPGPACTTDTVRSAAAIVPDLCHREADFFEVMQEVRADLVGLAGGSTETHSTVIFSGSGTASVEATIASVVPDERRILIVDNGVYGDRMAKMAQAHGLQMRRLKYGWTEVAKPEDIDSILSEDDSISHIAVVHHETTTGLLNPIREIGQVAAKHGIRLIVDAMSSFCGEELNVVEDNIDFMISSSNKCIQGLPGLSFVIARRDLLLELEGRPARSVYLDLYNQWSAEEADNTPFTPAIQVFFQLRQAISELKDETLEARWQRYANCAQTLRDGMADIGFEILVDEGARSNLLTAFLLPEGVEYDPLHDAMKKRGYIIYAGQSDLKKIAFRISNLGTLTPEDMKGVVVAIRDSLAEIRGDSKP
jgi:2-aminoethylphosphonate-pyruvate transaminase